MKAWHFSETAYPYLPPDSEYEFDPRLVAEPQLRSEEGGGAVRPLH